MGSDAFCWPVAYSELNAARNSFHCALMREASQRADCRNGILLGHLGVFLTQSFLALFLAQMLMERTARLGGEVTFSPSASLQNALFQGQSLPTRWAKYLSAGIRRPSFWRRAWSSMRSCVAGDPFSRALFGIGVNDGYEPITPSISPMILQCARASEHNLRLVNLGYWFDKRGVRPSSLDLGAILDAIADAVFIAFGPSGSKPLPATVEFLRRETAEALPLMDAWLIHLLSDPKLLPRNLWTGTGGLMWSRLLRAAVQLKGGRSTGFHHAHNQGMFKTQSDCCVELPGLDRLYVWTSLQVELSRRNIDSAFLPGVTVAEILPCPGRFLDPGLRPRRHNLRQRTAMLLGNIYDDEKMMWSPRPPVPVTVNMEVRVISTLQKAGYQVAFKGHPEALSCAGTIYERELGVRCLTGKFEQVWDEADVAVFTNPSTTPFSLLLSTDMPMVLVTHEYKVWHPEAVKLLAKRVALVHGRTEEDNRISFCQDELCDALKRAPSLVENQDYFQAFYSRKG